MLSVVLRFSEMWYVIPKEIYTFQLSKSAQKKRTREQHNRIVDDLYRSLRFVSVEDHIAVIYWVQLWRW
jgi:hypothetical protein